MKTIFLIVVGGLLIGCLIGVLVSKNLEEL